MSHLLLTGAGFSRNWGGWLADEVFEYLLGDPQLTPHMRDMLWADRNSGGNYENTIQRFRDAVKRSPAEETCAEELNKFISILGGMFNAMKKSFSVQQFDFQSAHRHVSLFLNRFDAIYTLNQDTLLEIQYFGRNIFKLGAGRWQGWDIPGISTMTPQHVHVEGGNDPASLHIFKAPPYALQGGGYQPYFKLHGSHNWLASKTSGQLLIMGGNKETDIGESPLLAWYSTKFREAVCHSSARLMIIGYSFGDPHINRILFDAAKSGAKFFIVDPAGIGAYHKTQKGHDDRFQSEFSRHVIGASRRSLRTTVESDTVEAAKLDVFFSS